MVSQDSAVRFFRRPWNESRGDNFDSWGRAVYYFATNTQGVVLRQVELYENGTVLVYDEDHSSDDYGQLSESPLNLADFAAFEISREEFEREVGGARPFQE